MKRIYIYLVLLLAGAVIFSACENRLQQTKELRIAVSKEGSTLNYSNWLKRYHQNVRWFDLYPLGIDSALSLLETCDGLLLTGGEDVFPGRYGKAADTVACGTINTYRDSLEFALIGTARAAEMPVFGICRGEQILNIYFGGTLYVDIPTVYDSTVAHRQKDWRNCYHPVTVLENTQLFALAGVRSGDVTSNHHQGIEVLGDGLRVSALAADSLPEAIEWAQPGEKAFLMAVQWHPERMDTLHPLSAPLAKKFLEEAVRYGKNH